MEQSPPQPQPQQPESAPSLPPLPHIPQPGEAPATENTAPVNAAADPTPALSHSNKGGEGAIDPFPPAVEPVTPPATAPAITTSSVQATPPAPEPEPAQTAAAADAPPVLSSSTSTVQQSSPLPPMGSTPVNAPAPAAPPSALGLGLGLQQAAPASSVNAAPPALPADYVRQTKKQKAGWGGSTYTFLGVLLFVLVYLAGIPWLSAYLTKNASTLNFGKMSVVLNDLTLPWYRMSTTPAVHDVMVQYQSFCFETLGLHPITDMTINDVGAVSYQYKNGNGS